MGLFKRAVNGMPDVGQGDGWTAAQWRRAPKARIPVAKLVSTNLGGYLSASRVRKYRNGGGGTPCVIQDGGSYYVADGHHRAAAAIARGEKHITVHLKRGR